MNIFMKEKLNRINTIEDAVSLAKEYDWLSSTTSGIEIDEIYSQIGNKDTEIAMEAYGKVFELCEGKASLRHVQMDAAKKALDLAFTGLYCCMTQEDVENKAIFIPGKTYDRDFFYDFIMDHNEFVRYSRDVSAARRMLDALDSGDLKKATEQFEQSKLCEAVEESDTQDSTDCANDATNDNHSMQGNESVGGRNTSSRGNASSSKKLSSNTSSSGKNGSRARGRKKSSVLSATKDRATGAISSLTKGVAKGTKNITQKGTKKAAQMPKNFDVRNRSRHIRWALFFFCFFMLAAQGFWCGLSKEPLSFHAMKAFLTDGFSDQVTGLFQAYADHKLIIKAVYAVDVFLLILAGVSLVRRVLAILIIRFVPFTWRIRKLVGTAVVVVILGWITPILFAKATELILEKYLTAFL